MLEQSFYLISNRTATRDATPQPVELWRPFLVEITENDVRTGGQDVGGVQREWFECMGNELFTCKHGLFKRSLVNGEYRLFINEDSETCNENHLDWFTFSGRLIGLSLIHDCTMPVPLCDYVSRKSKVERGVCCVLLLVVPY